MRARLFQLLAIIVAVSCIDTSKYDVDGVTLSPTYALPIASGDMGFIDLVSSEDSSYVRAYPDGLLYFHFSETLGSTEIRDLFNFPNDTTIAAFDLPDGTLPASSSSQFFGTINKQIDLGLSPELLTEALMKGGTIEYNLAISPNTSPPNLPLQATVTLTDVLHKTTGLPLTFVATNGSGSKQIQDYVIHMINNQFNAQVDLVILPHASTFIPPTAKANVQLAFVAMQYGYIKGFLGDQTTQLPPQTIKLSVFGSSLKDAGVSFVEPHVSMRVVNDYGATSEVSFSVLRASKGATTLPIQINPTSPITLNFPAVLGQSATTNVLVTNEQAIVNFGPENLEYTATARINKGLSNATNFLADTSKLRVTLETEIPIYGRVTGVNLIDTLDIDLGDQIAASKVQSATLTVNALNELPLDAFMQIYFMNKNFVVLDSVFAPNEKHIVRASTVNAAGDLQTPMSTQLDVQLDPLTVTYLFDAKHLLVKAVMRTGHDANDTPLNVKFRSSYRLKLKVGLLTKFDITLD